MSLVFDVIMEKNKTLSKIILLERVSSGYHEITQIVKNNNFDSSIDWNREICCNTK
jgi:hypothetical protein